tara:strand:+ start:120 stop:434 length:315 start_codon:yes stop_codon:yes gene_type:complete
MKDILRLSLPLTFWLIAFSGLYGLQGLLCSSRWAMGGDDGGRVILQLAALLAVVCQVGMILALRSDRWSAGDGMIRRTSVLLAVVALVATAWTLVPTAVTTYCG